MRDWLRELAPADRNVIGQDLVRAQFRWPIGMPLCRALGGGLQEVRRDLAGNRIAVSRKGVYECCTAYQEDPKDAGCRTRSGASANARVQMKADSMTTKKIRSTKGLSTLDDFLEEGGTREKFQAVAIKEVLAWQIAEAMKAQGLSQKRLAERMGTSRSQITRLLDPKDGNVTLVTLQRAAELLGRKVRLELV
jgi:antitoxin HicB